MRVGGLRLWGKFLSAEPAPPPLRTDDGMSQFRACADAENCHPIKSSQGEMRFAITFSTHPFLFSSFAEART